MSFLLGLAIFRGNVKFPGCMGGRVFQPTFSRQEAPFFYHENPGLQRGDLEVRMVDPNFLPKMLQRGELEFGLPTFIVNLSQM